MSYVVIRGCSESMDVVALEAYWRHKGQVLFCHIAARAMWLTVT
jgi:hypothetical protein